MGNEAVWSRATGTARRKGACGVTNRPLTERALRPGGKAAAPGEEATPQVCAEGARGLPLRGQPSGPAVIRRPARTNDLGGGGMPAGRPGGREARLAGGTQKLGSGCGGEAPEWQCAAWLCAPRGEGGL